MSMPRNERSRIHGLYSKVITKAEKRELARVHTTDIEGEIAYLRSLCRRLAEIVNANGLEQGAVLPLDDRTIRTLNAMDLKMNTLLRYIRAQAYLKGEPNEYDRQIDEGQFLARRARNVFNYLSSGTAEQPGDGPGEMGDVGAE
jgi:hypothetical protein